MKIEFENSKTVRSAEHFPESKKLHVTYSTGKKYEYSGVHDEIFTGLKSAESAGSFIAHKIKGKYPYRLIE